MGLNNSIVSPSNSISISVLIRSFNSSKFLNEILSKLDIDENDECIIVDSGSTDSTIEIATSHQTQIICIDPPFNYSRSLNAGFAVAQGDWILVLSSHCIPLRSDLIKRLREVAATVDDDVAVIYGRVSLYDPGQPSPRVQTGSQADWRTRQFLAGGNGFAMYPKSLWDLHAFNERLITAEDLDWLAWAFSTGRRAAIVWDTIVLYRNQGNLTYMFRKGWNEALLARSIYGSSTVGKSYLRGLRSLAINSLYLTKLLIMRKFGIKAYLRMISHGLGAELSTVSDPPVQTSQARD
jgi:rhamnosyltransferase